MRANETPARALHNEVVRAVTVDVHARAREVCGRLSLSHLTAPVRVGFENRLMTSRVGRAGHRTGVSEP
jgi:hypothetical protein